MEPVFTERLSHYSLHAGTHVAAADKGQQPVVAEIGTLERAHDDLVHVDDTCQPAVIGLDQIAEISRVLQLAHISAIRRAGVRRVNPATVEYPAPLPGGDKFSGVTLLWGFQVNPR